MFDSRWVGVAVLAVACSSGGTPAQGDAGADAATFSSAVSHRLSVGAHGCFVMADGSARCWGRGGPQSHLGDGTDEVREAPVTAQGLTCVVSLSAGDSHTCALRTDGSVWCWGENASGQLGDGTTSAHNAPTRVMGVDGVVEVRVSASRTCARRGDGTVWCWGRALEDGMTHMRPERVAQVTGAAEIALQDDSVGGGRNPRAGLCVRRNDGTVWCFSVAEMPSTTPTTLTRVPAVADAVEIASGRAGACARTRAGAVWCWGDNTRGQLGVGDLEAHADPVQVQGVENVASIAVGQSHMCARTQGGAVWCWGANSSGAVGASMTSDQPRPAVVPGIEDAAEIAAGNAGTCALTRSGAVSCWGTRDSGILGTGPVTTTRFTPPHVVRGLEGVVRLHAGDATTCATTGDGTTRCWGADLLRVDGATRNLTHLFPSQDQGPQGFTSIVSDGAHRCAITPAATVQCWGINTRGQVGDGTTTEQQTPLDVPGLTGVTMLALGQEHSCALRMDGSVWCWGSNEFHQISSVGQENRLEPQRVEGLPRVTAISSMTHTVCAITEDRRVLCWGRDVSGETGQSTSMFWRATPIAVPDLTGAISMVSAGVESCARREGGSVTCWGFGGSTSGDGLASTFAAFNDVDELMLYGYSRCARDHAGAVRCSEYSEGGWRAPTTIDGPAQVTALAGGDMHACALTMDGHVWCWGADTDGQLGNGCYAFGCAAPQTITF